MSGRRAAGRGMTLVELIVASMISLVIGGVVLTLLAGYISLTIANHDAMTAASRAETVFLVLDRPLHHAGLGLPTATEGNYSGAWGNDGPLVKDWGNDCRDAIFVTPDNDEIGVVYAVPSGLFVESGPDQTGRLTLLGHNLPAEIAPQGAGNLDSWVVAPGTENPFPMEVTANETNGTQTLTVRVPGVSGHVLRPHQELHLLKGFRAFIDDDRNFRMAEITNQTNWSELTGPGVTVEGIRAVRFFLSDDRKTLEIRVLAMGDSSDTKRSGAMLARLRNRWPELGSDPTDGGRYFEEFTTRWRIRNMEERDDA